MSVFLDPDFSLRVIIVLSAFTGGLAALTERRGGGWLAGISAALFFVQTMALLSGRGAEGWLRETVALTTLTALFLAFTVSRGKAFTSQTPKPEQVSA